MLAITRDLDRVRGIFAIGAAVFFTFGDWASARRMGAYSFGLFGHRILLSERGAIRVPSFAHTSLDLIDKVSVTDFLQNAESIFETAAAADGVELESGSVSILISQEGSIRMVMGSDWTLESLQQHHGSKAAYRVSRSGAILRVEGKSRNGSCLLQSEPAASVAKRMLADRPRYLLAA
jgi:hypothetical protein